MVWFILMPSHFNTKTTSNGNFMKKKTKPKKKTIDPFKELVLALSKKTHLPDRAGKGVVSGNDVASMKDILEQGRKDV